jgi:hypothetical protein
MFGDVLPAGNRALSDTAKPRNGAGSLVREAFKTCDVCYPAFPVQRGNVGGNVVCSGMERNGHTAQGAILCGQIVERILWSSVNKGQGLNGRPALSTRIRVRRSKKKTAGVVQAPGGQCWGRGKMTASGDDRTRQYPVTDRLHAACDNQIKEHGHECRASSEKSRSMRPGP